MNINNKAEADISKIKSNNIVKLLFSYLDSNNILKLVQNNKNLQNKLNINIENYKKKYDFPTYTIYEKKIIKSIPMRNKFMLNQEELETNCGRCISTCTYSILFLFLLVYAILLITLDTFDDNNTKKDYDKSLENIINKINKSLFILIGFIIVSWATLYFFIYVDCIYDIGFKKILKSILMIIIDIIHFAFEGLVIWKLIISYQIIEGDIPWFMKMDYTFLSLNLLHIIFAICLTIFFFKDSGSQMLVYSDFYLTSFNNIKIRNSLLPYSFLDKTEKERKKYLLKKYYYYSIKKTKNFFFIHFIINNKRKEMNIPELKVDEDDEIPNYIINAPGEILLYPENNIFKLANNEYLFKYRIGEFENKVKNNDKEVI